MRFALPALAVFALAGCVNPALVPVSYDGAVAGAPEKPASLHMSTGIVEADYAPGGAQVWVNPKVLFDLEDQRVFGESLRSELNRLKLLRVGNVSWQAVEPAEVTIEIVFQRTVAFPPAVIYHLDVVMRLKSGERSFARRYFVASNQGESFWTNMNTDAPKGKAFAAKKLMARLIPDIEAFISRP